jgi:hypothetical protein
MEPISAVVTALALGAAAALNGVSGEAIKDAHAGLKALIQRKYAQVHLAQLEEKPESKSRRAIVEEELMAAGAGQDEELFGQAKALMDAIQREAPETDARTGFGLIANRMGGDLEQGKRATLSQQEKAVIKTGPVRGSLRFNLTASSAQVTAGSDFSIFVLIQNPFDVPITIYQVHTHIPVELVDINGRKLYRARREGEHAQNGWVRRICDSIRDRVNERSLHTGIAIAVGTDFDPLASKRPLTNISISDAQVTSGGMSVVGFQLQFPQNPSSEYLDKIFRRLTDYEKGLIPITLQPGDSVVRQFVLRTRAWLFFTPLTHTFEIQVNYSSDGIDHSDTVAYQQSIRSTISAMTLGAMVGAFVGTLVKSLAKPAPLGKGVTFQAIIGSMLSSVAVVVAFARKNSAQSIVSIEDFWGGALIGFSTGFFGFEQFVNLFLPSNHH